MTDLVPFFMGTLILRWQNEEYFGKTVIPAVHRRRGFCLRCSMLNMKVNK